MTAIKEVLSERDASKSELCRLIFLDARLKLLTNLPQHDLAAFLKVSEGLVSRCRRQAQEEGEAGIDRTNGRPAFLPPANEEEIRRWIAEKTAVRDWPSIRDLKEQIVAELEKINADIVPSQSYYAKVLPRLLRDDFHVRNAQPLKEARYDVSPEIIRLHFEKLSQTDICNISPHLILNLDETGFGASKSGRTKSRKVIVPSTFLKTPVFKEKTDSHFVTALCAISAAGDMLPPALITKRETEHPDSDQCNYIPNARRYSTPKAFVTRKIFSDYLLTVISPYVTKMRESIGPNAPALILFDGHKSHLSDLLNAWAAQHPVILYSFPPHSSHLLQPLDQGFFRRLKIQYGLFAPVKGISKISGTLERIWMAVQAATITRIIWNAWSHTGIVAMISQGVCVGCTLDLNRVLSEPAMQTAIGGATPIFEGGRGKGISTGAFGILNEDEMMIWDAGQCPFCYHPLRSGE
jgi:transposase